jgi:hypothetical protein
MDSIKCVELAGASCDWMASKPTFEGLSPSSSSPESVRECFEAFYEVLVLNFCIVANKRSHKKRS